MNEDFRNRVAVPLLLPIAVLLGAAVFVVGLAVVLLAIPAVAATIIALLVAAYVLGISTMLVKRRTISGRAIGVGGGLGMAGLVVAAVIAFDVGPREITPPAPEDEEEVVEEEEEEEEEDDEAVDIPADAYEFVAVDIDYADAPETVSSGLVTFALINEGQLDHDVVIEELGDLEVVFTAGGEVDVGEVELEAGEEYTYYCSIPGHRAAGMEGTLTVED